MASSTTDGGGRVVLLLRDERHPRDAYKTVSKSNGTRCTYPSVIMTVAGGTRVRDGVRSRAGFQLHPSR